MTRRDPSSEINRQPRSSPWLSSGSCLLSAGANGSPPRQAAGGAARQTWEVLPEVLTSWHAHGSFHLFLKFLKMKSSLSRCTFSDLSSENQAQSRKSEPAVSWQWSPRPVPGSCCVRPLCSNPVPPGALGRLHGHCPPHPCPWKAGWVFLEVFPPSRTGLL